jgi:hypothetical protein
MRQTVKKRNSHNKTKKHYVYKKSDYQSGDGMLTTVWGPAMWHYLHTMSFNYPVNPTQEDKKNYRNFILNLRNVLPCKYCRINLKNNLLKKPLQMCDMKNRVTFSRYIYDLHEVINTMLKKKSGLTYTMVRERYEHFRSRCTKSYRDFKKLRKTRRKQNSEKGCTEPLYGEKSKCVIKIVPQTDKTETFKIDEKCIKRRE